MAELIQKSYTKTYDDLTPTSQNKIDTIESNEWWEFSFDLQLFKFEKHYYS